MNCGGAFMLPYQRKERSTSVFRMRMQNYSDGELNSLSSTSDIMEKSDEKREENENENKNEKTEHTNQNPSSLRMYLPACALSSRAFGVVRCFAHQQFNGSNNK